MSHPFDPQRGPQDATGSDPSSLAAGRDSSAQDSVQADPTTDLSDSSSYERTAGDRAEFDNEFDDQDRLREQTPAAPGSPERNLDQDRTIRTDYQYGDQQNADRTLTDGSGLPPAVGITGSAVTDNPTADDRPSVVDDPAERAMPTTIPPDRETVAAREKERFGGMSFGSGFFGWLTATGMAVLLITLVAAAGVALGIAANNTVDQVVQNSQTDTGTAQTVGLVGGILLLVILFVSYFCGGYVAGRMARFSGAKQGLAVWLWALITTALIAAIGAIAGSQYNVLAQLNLPRIPVDEGSVTTAGIIAIAAAILVALIGALIGGVTGTRFHRKVDAVGFQDDGRAF